MDSTSFAAVLFTALTIATSAWLVYVWLAVNEARRWPVREATVTSRSCERRVARGGPRFVAAMTYEYAVGDATFTGRRIRLGGPLQLASEASADAWLRQMAPGTPIRVYVSPQRPDESVVDPSLPAWFGAAAMSPLLTGALAAYYCSTSFL